MQNNQNPSVESGLRNHGIQKNVLAYPPSLRNFADLPNHVSVNWDGFSFDPLDYPAGIPMCELVPDWFDEILED